MRLRCAANARATALSHATDGPNWETNENWLTDAPIGEWFGVTTNSDGRVSVLDLHSGGLNGEIPPELANMSYLFSLDLRGNEFTGCLPSALRAQLSGLAGLPFCT